MRNRLKRVLTFIIISLVFIPVCVALDYSNIEFSDSIKIEDNDKITIKLPINYKNNNSKIDYQLIETSKETIDEYERRGAELLQNLATQHSECVTSDQNFSQSSECLTFLEQANSQLHAYLPDFDDGKWIIKDFNNFNETNVIYEIDNNLDEYNWIWIRAKDENGNTIYQISSIAPKSSSQEDETIADTNITTDNGSTGSSTDNDISNETYDIPDTAINSKIVKLIGSCFLVCALAVLYLYFKNKEKKQ